MLKKKSDFEKNVFKVSDKVFINKIIIFQLIQNHLFQGHKVNLLLQMLPPKYQFALVHVAAVAARYLR